MSEPFLLKSVSRLTSTVKVRGLTHYQTSIRAVPVVICEQVDRYCQGERIDSLPDQCQSRSCSHYFVSRLTGIDRYCQGERIDSLNDQTSVRAVPVVICEQFDRYCQGERTASLQDQHQSCFSCHLCGCVLVCRLRVCLFSSVPPVPLRKQPAVKHLKV